MKVRKEIHPAYVSFSSFVDQIPEVFDSQGELIHNGRNIVKKFFYKDEIFVVKSFKKVTWFNRIVYSFIRKSKSQRAYEYGLYLLREGIANPDPVAYINTYKNGILFQSFYISKCIEDRPLKDFLDKPFGEVEALLKDLARFAFSLHQKNIYHKDFNVTNIYCKPTTSGYEFSLIDFNRMSFSPHSKSQRLKNLHRLGLPLDKIGIFINEYSRLSGFDSLESFYLILKYKRLFWRKKKFLRRLKFWKK